MFLTASLGQFGLLALQPIGCLQ